MIISILLFAAVGLAFGYAFGGVVAWLVALGLPAVVAALTVAGDGWDDFNVLAFIVTMVLAGVGVVVGSLLRERAERAAPQA